MTPHVLQLVEYLKKFDINFSPTDGELENVVFTQGDKVVKIAHKCFYRFSGLCYIQKTKKDNYIDLIEVTDDMFINTYQRMIIEKIFKV